jgi:hypothetical protein
LKELNGTFVNLIIIFLRNLNKINRKGKVSHRLIKSSSINYIYSPSLLYYKKYSEKEEKSMILKFIKEMLKKKKMIVDGLVLSLPNKNNGFYPRENISKQYMTISKSVKGLVDNYYKTKLSLTTSSLSSSSSSKNLMSSMSSTDLLPNPSLSNSSTSKLLLLNLTFSPLDTIRNLLPNADISINNNDSNRSKLMVSPFFIERKKRIEQFSFSILFFILLTHNIIKKNP